MRLLGLILVMMMISTSSQSSEMKDWTLCSQIAKSMDAYLSLHSTNYDVLEKLEIGTDAYFGVVVWRQRQRYLVTKRQES